MWKLAGLVTLTAIFVVGPAGLAQGPPAGSATVYGPGIASCGRWVTERAQARDSQFVGANLGWVLGFLSGYGYSGLAANFSLKDTDFDAVDAWMKNYCEAHPLERIVDAAIVLVRELKEL